VSKSALLVSETAYETKRYTGIDSNEKNKLDAIEVFPTSSFRAICRVVQKEIIFSEIKKYPIKVPINAQVPNSSGVRRRVTIIVKIRPVKTLAILIVKEINPE